MNLVCLLHSDHTYKGIKLDLQSFTLSTLRLAHTRMSFEQFETSLPRLLLEIAEETDCYLEYSIEKATFWSKALGENIPTIKE